ncbi:ead/Ea22-like family protein [Klebsiella pneumoniae]
MTTDITELAQSLKAAVEKAGIEQWVNNRGEVNTADYEVDGGVYIDHICNCEIVGTESPRAEFIALANPANILALVEALEKAQQVDEELCKLLPPGAEYMDPPDGGDVTPLEGVRRMVADYRQRIAELESRNVKLPSTRLWAGVTECYEKADVIAAIRAAGMEVSDD